MPYVVVGVVLWLLWRYYAKQHAAAQIPAQQAQRPQGPDSFQPAPPDQTQPPTPPPSPPPAPAPTPPPAPSVSDQWVPVTGTPPVATPGATYRASAPPQNLIVMMALRSGLEARGFTNVVIYKPGDAFPADWPDSGDKLRVQATLAADQQPQSLDVDGMTLWKLVPGQLSGQAVWNAVQKVGQQMQAQVQQATSRYPHPKDFGVYAGLVRRQR